MKVSCFICVSVLASGVAVGSKQENYSLVIDRAFRARAGHCLDRLKRSCKEALSHINHEVVRYIREWTDYNLVRESSNIPTLIAKLNECEQLKQQIEAMSSSIEKFTVQQEGQSDSEESDDPV